MPYGDRNGEEIKALNMCIRILDFNGGRRIRDVYEGDSERTRRQIKQIKTWTIHLMCGEGD
jgi:hypothetical protein